MLEKPNNTNLQPLDENSKNSQIQLVDVDIRGNRSSWIIPYRYPNFFYDDRTPDAMKEDYLKSIQPDKKLVVKANKLLGEVTTYVLQLKNKLNPNIFPLLARSYAEVFATPPWNEYTVSGCGTYFGLETAPGDSCPQCDDKLSLAYPIDDTSNYIDEELSRDNAILTILNKNSTIMGWAWGYSYMKPEDFASEKSKSESMKTTIINILSNSGVTGEFFYMSECGINPTFRNQGLGQAVIQPFMEIAQQLELPLVGRTSALSPMSTLLRRNGMKQIFGPVSTRSTVTGDLEFSGENINGIDSENSQRVLFIK